MKTIVQVVRYEITIAGRSGETCFIMLNDVFSSIIVFLLFNEERLRHEDYKKLKDIARPNDTCERQSLN